MTPQHPHQFSLFQASHEHPGLARILAQQKESQARLRAIEALLPANLKPFIKCGRFEAGVWCLLLDNNTAAAKLRQLLPLFEEKLNANALPVERIRLKISRQH